MGKPIRVLIVEDSEDDADLLVWALRRGGLEPDYERVDCHDDMSAALKSKTWDMVLCDYKMPGFGCHQALELTRKLGHDVPLIVVSGVIGEESAAQLMKQGARDFILKDNLVRLVPAVDRELSDFQERQERAQAEALVRKLSRVVEDSPLLVMITDVAGDIEYVNPYFTEITGYEHEEVIGKNPRFLKSGDTSPEEYKHLWETITSGGVWRGQFHNKKKNGELFWESACISPVKGGDGTITHFVGIKEDTTERQQARAQLIQADKLATLCEMATGIAHELNQPLTVIKMAADISIERIEEGQFDPEYVLGKFERISTQIDRAAAIIDHMRILGRRSGEQTEEIDVPKVVLSALRLTDTQLRLCNIEVETKFPERCPKVLGQMVQLEQVVLNLLGNARDAIEANRPSPRVPGNITLIVEDAGPQDGIKLIVRDTGGGIPADVLPRVFEPFFTTKTTGKVTGLGLSISYGIITEMGGVIEVANADDGAEVTVSLPLADPQPTTAGDKAG